jgi:electron transfer flavoprotein alpha subunit
MANILVYALHYDGAINKNSLGAVSEGAALAAELGGEAHAILLGENVPQDLAASLGKYGAKKVLVAEGPEGLAQPLVDAMAAAISGGDYKYALFGGGLLGFEIGAGLAARLGAGVVMEVTSVRAENGELIAERPILGDSSISEVKYRSAVGIVIGRLNAFEIRDAGGADAPVETLSFELSAQAQQATMLTRGEQRGADVDIEGADILVAGGRGLGKPEGFQLAEDLAKAFGGNSAVAATRAVVDAGWYPYAAQIGQTGKTVAPKLYLAAGISGAIQHKVGMQGSENIVAINKDANAPIFEFSDLGIVGDLNKILPQRLQQREGRARGLPPGGGLAQGVHQARPRRRGRADRGRRGDRRRRHRRPGVRQSPAATAGRR